MTHFRTQLAVILVNSNDDDFKKEIINRELADDETNLDPYLEWVMKLIARVTKKTH